jgi:hypothetical protein
MENILRWSANILIVSGCLDADHNGDGLRTRFGEQVQRIAKATCKLECVMKEEIMSTNFSVITVDHSQTFDSKNMCDAFGDYGTSRGLVLCTTELGLRCSTRKNLGGSGKVEMVERQLLVRPKVLLESVVDVF